MANPELAQHMPMKSADGAVDGPPVFNFVLVKLASRCNIACAYCYWFRDSEVYNKPAVLTAEALLDDDVCPTELMAVLMALAPEKRWVYCPICRVLSSSDLAVFMTSTLFWYEREAEIMFTISSTAFTLA